MATPAAAPTEAVDSRALYRKISLRLIPYMFLLYILAYLDRVNVGYAALQLKADLHMSDAVYGTGAGLFFVGSALFDIPSNLILARVGPRRWMARIMISWGAVAASMSLMGSAHMFYMLRFLLGITEAGFFPGMILYLTYWFPSRERARSISRFMTATAIAGVIGGPLASSLLQLDGTGELYGWQWLFLAEGLPTILAGVSVLFLLPEHPREAGWLSPGEQQWVESQVLEDRKAQGSGGHTRFFDALRLPSLYAMAAVFIACQVGVYVINLWLPLFLHATPSARQLGPRALGIVTALPYLVTAVAMVLVGWSSDKLRDRRFHVAGCMAVSALGLALAVRAHSLPAVLFAFSLATLGVFAVQGPFWTWLTSNLEGTAAAGGIAIITCLGGLGAYAGQVAVGWLSTHSHSYASGLEGVSGVVFLGAVAALLLKNPKG